MRLVWQLAWRFRSSKQENGFISFISASSTAGIALGSFVLILLLSVMNGFERELKDRLLAVIPHGEVWSVNNDGIHNWPVMIDSMTADQRITTVEPFSKATGMLQAGKSMKALELTALSPQHSKSGSLREQVTETTWEGFTQSSDALILGRGVMTKLNLTVGQKVQVLLPQLSEDLSLKPPKNLWLTIVGEVHVGGELDSHLGVFRLEKAAEVMNISSGAQGLRFSFVDPFIAPAAMRDIGYSFEQHVYMSDWTRTQGHLYQDIQLVRTVVYIALTLVIAVACFNIVSTLVMAVNEKQAEIAMLKTMGARDRLIVKVFVTQGLINGLVGTFIGSVAGVLLSLNLTDAARSIESVIGTSILSGDIYFVDFLPSQLNWTEVIFTVCIALSLTFLATLYPARKATRIDPATALGRY